MRVGDQDDYHDFDSPEIAAEDLAQYIGVYANTVRRYVGPGLVGVEVGDWLVGDNAVSLFWGDGDAQLEAELSDQELEAFDSTLQANT